MLPNLKFRPSPQIYSALYIFSGKYNVDPDSGGKPFLVRCSFPDNSTIIGKDVEIQVGKCNEFQCYEAKMDYEMPVAQMKKLFALSGSCIQRIDFKCKLAPLKVIEIQFRLILKCGVLKVFSLIGCFCTSAANRGK